MPGEIDFRQVQRSTTVTPGDRVPRSFPARADYLAHLVSQGVIRGESDLLARPELVARIQQDWHRRGQNGCRFAQFLSSDPPAHGWARLVVTGVGTELDRPEILADAGAEVRAAIEDDRTQAVSVLFPEVVSTAALVALLRALARLPGWRAQVGPEPLRVAGQASLLLVEVRVPLGPPGAFSWALGLGPFGFLALTRQAPFTELALVAKPKPLPVRFGEMNDDPTAAHLADMPVPVEQAAFERMWGGTKRSKRMILGGADPRARARVTFAVPEDAWRLSPAVAAGLGLSGARAGGSAPARSRSRSARRRAPPR